MQVLFQRRMADRLLKPRDSGATLKRLRPGARLPLLGYPRRESLARSVYKARMLFPQSLCRALSERNVAVFFRRIGITLILQKREGANQFRSGQSGLDHFVYEAALGRDVRIGKFLFKLLNA